jgi:hypothetical protein
MIAAVDAAVDGVEARRIIGIMPDSSAAAWSQLRRGQVRDERVAVRPVGVEPATSVSTTSFDRRAPSRAPLPRHPR